ncbi:MAG: hypothetical protein EA381_06160 [Planctomycetaceae bacterium]|nr:MAG: hypothetical protein EA381_06160 [Planctomycetaceae bacterium]
MNRPLTLADAANRRRPRSVWSASAVVLVKFAIVLLSLLPAGCQQIRLPAIDPTGSRLFAPHPTSTTLALPCMGGEGCVCLTCLGTIRRHLADHHAKTHNKLDSFTNGLVNPAFPQPADPPVCIEASGPTHLPHGGKVLGDSSFDNDCLYGPPAVLYGDEVLGGPRRSHHRLPATGNRGSILLSPQRIVAPVGGEVILLSGICGQDGHLQVGQPLEWMLTNDSVGTFIEVGNDAPGMLHRLAKIQEPDKRSGTYAIGVTSTKRSLITRGNRDRNDDVPLDKGQTWLSISSPSEGVSRVTVLAPQSDCWDQRKATATIYWIDARWQFPASQRELAGTPVTLSTRVTKAEGNQPARGWTVRYEVLNPELALFVAPGAASGSGGSTVLDVAVDSSGNATAELVPLRKADGNFTSGTATIRMQVIRPGGERDNFPDLPLGTGQTFVTWSAPQLELRTAAPDVAGYDQPVEVVANIRNPGDQPATNVRVSVALPPGSRATQADSFARITPSNVTWEIGTIPPRTQLDLFMSIASQATVRLPFEARGDDGLYAQDTVAINVFRPSLAIRVEPSATDAVEVGTPITFNIDVTNTGERPLTGVNLRAVGDNAMTHEETGSRVISQNKPDGTLQPGATWSSAVTFVPLESGRRCVIVEAYADGGQQSQSEACATVINRVVPVPAITATITGPAEIQAGTDRLFSYRVVNTGQVPLSNVRISVTFDATLRLVEATEGSDVSRLGQFQIGWTIPSMPVSPDPRSTILLEGRFNAGGPIPQSLMILTVESAEGARASDSFRFEITPAAFAPPAQAAPQTLPPIVPSPMIPEAPAPIPADPSIPAPDLPPVAPRAADPAPAGDTLVLSLLDRDDPVRVGQPIRYSLSVRNIANEVDSAVAIRFALPNGVELTRIVQRLAPAENQFGREGDTIYLDDIRDLRPGEAIDFDIELVSNQPQQLELVVQAISRLVPGGTQTSQTTRVLP